MRAHSAAQGARTPAARLRRLCCWAAEPGGTQAPLPRVRDPVLRGSKAGCAVTLGGIVMPGQTFGQPTQTRENSVLVLKK